MPKRKFHTDPNVLLQEGRRLVSTEDDPTFRHRVEAVNLVVSGMTPARLAELFRESASTIALWVRTADEKGFDALRPKKASGRPPKLDDAQYAALRSVLAEPPERHGCESWDGPALSDYIQRTWGISLGERQCRRLLRQLAPDHTRDGGLPQCKH